MKQENASKLLEIFQDLPILPKAEIYCLNFHTNTFNIHVEMIYRIGQSEPLIVEPFGVIINDEFVDYRSTNIISRRRQNFQGYNLRASIVVTENDTLTHLDDYR